MSAAEIPHDTDDRFDPMEASTREVIGQFLNLAENLNSSDETARYVATLLAVKDTTSLGEDADLLHARLRTVIIDSDITDGRWEDDDVIAGIIYRMLKETKTDSKIWADQRLALWRLLELRGADVKSQEDTVAAGENAKRWNDLLHKLGGKALG